jgi:hypothetical protein
MIHDTIQNGIVEDNVVREDKTPPPHGAFKIVA